MRNIISKAKPITAGEKQLRKAVCDVVASYEDQYILNNNRGLFVERLVKRLNDREQAAFHWQCVEQRAGDWDTWLRTSIGLTFSDCSSRSSGLSIPSKIRQQIEDQIIQAMIDKAV